LLRRFRDRGRNTLLGDSLGINEQSEERRGGRHHKNNITLWKISYSARDVPPVETQLREGCDSSGATTNREHPRNLSMAVASEVND